MTEADQELLSAYLDGEVAGPERLRAETLLHSDPAARQYLAELESIRRAVREQPAESLPAEYAASILQRISATNTTDHHPVTRDDAARPSEAGAWFGASGRGWRPLAYAALATAAALVVMFLSPRRTAELAVNTATKDTAQQHAARQDEEAAPHRPAPAMAPAAVPPSAEYSAPDAQMRARKSRVEPAQEPESMPLTAESAALPQLFVAEATVASTDDARQALEAALSKQGLRATSASLAANDKARAAAVVLRVAADRAQLDRVLASLESAGGPLRSLAYRAMTEAELSASLDQTADQRQSQLAAVANSDGTAEQKSLAGAAAAAPGAEQSAPSPAANAPAPAGDRAPEESAERVQAVFILRPQPAR